MSFPKYYHNTQSKLIDSNVSAQTLEVTGTNRNVPEYILLDELSPTYIISSSDNRRVHIVALSSTTVQVDQTYVLTLNDAGQDGIEKIIIFEGNANTGNSLYLKLLTFVSSGGGLHFFGDDTFFKMNIGQTIHLISAGSKWFVVNTGCEIVS